MRKIVKKSFSVKKKVSAPIPISILDLGFGFQYRNLVLVVDDYRLLSIYNFGAKVCVEKMSCVEITISSQKIKIP